MAKVLKETIRLIQRKNQNGRFTFMFKSPETCIEVSNKINRSYSFTSANEFIISGLLPPKPFHYIVDIKKEASTPLFVDISEYVTAIEAIFPDRFTIRSEVSLKDPTRKICLKLQYRQNA